MKSLFKFIFAVFMPFLEFSTINAATVTVDIDKLRYTVDTDANTAEVYGLANAYISATITDLVIPDYIPYNDGQIPVTSIGDDAFGLKTNLKGSLTIGNNVQTIGSYAFSNCTGFTGSLMIPNSVTKIGQLAFSECSGFKGSLTISNSVHIIEKSTFSGCSGFTGSLTIPNSVQTIEDTAFGRCSGFTGSLTIPSSVQTIGNTAFLSCKGFTGSLTIPNSITEIGKNAFMGCSGFTGSLTIPSSVQTIGAGAFFSCNFGEVKSYAINPATAGTTAFSDFYSSPLYVPAESVDKYKAAYEWKDFKYINPLQIEATDIKLNKSELELLIGESETLKATVSPDNTTDKTVTWKSDNQAIATVGADGTVTGVSVGTANITASCGTVSATCKVTVNPIVASSVTISVPDKDVFVGDKITLTASITPENTTDKTLVWASETPAIATVDASTGELTALAPGEAKITASCGTVSATCKVTVNPIVASSVTISIPDKDVFVGDKIKLTATVTPSNTTDQTLVWASETPAIATVDASTGELTALAPGEAKITASCGAISGTATITVKPIVAQSVKLDAEDITLPVGASQKLKATVSPDNTTDKTVTWKSDNEAIATVGADGTVTGVSVGTANITASSGTANAVCKVTVISNGLGDNEGTDDGDIKDDGSEDFDSITVTRSEEYVVARHGDDVTMWINTRGGNPDGWTYTWSLAGSVVGKNNELTVKADSKENASTLTTYSASVENTYNGKTLYSETFEFTIEAWQAASLPSDADVWISDSKIRSGNTLSMGVKEASGGYENNWQYSWTLDNDVIGAEAVIETLAPISEGTSKTVVSRTFAVTLSNPGPDGSLWTHQTLTAPAVDVYRRPEMPNRLLRKGDGTSCTFVVMSDLNDNELSELGYTFVYGCTAADGSERILATTPLRYCHTTEDVFRNPENDFWVYSTWTYDDGSVVSSGRRYLDGHADEDFDASDFGAASRAELIDGSDPENWITATAGAICFNIDSDQPTTITIHTAKGECVKLWRAAAGSMVSEVVKTSSLIPDTYIVSVRSGKTSVVKKIVIKQ